jgi:2-oxoglutarate dehydrogenase E2 component (dihydrolipoamide succinyltransferase)
MKSDIKVPSMGESISEAVIGQILASQGTIVKADAEILELETDKVNQVLYAPQAGKLSLAVKPGETVKIGQVIGSIEEVSQSPTLPSSLLEKGQSKEEGKSIKSEKKSTESSSLNPSLNSQPESKSVKVSNEREQSSIRQTKEAFLTALKDAAINPSSGVDLSSQKVLASQPVEILKDQSARKETRRPLSRIRKVDNV